MYMFTLSKNVILKIRNVYNVHVYCFYINFYHKKKYSNGILYNGQRLRLKSSYVS